jgi:thioredoxin reductase
MKLLAIAREQLQVYPTVTLMPEKIVSAEREEGGLFRLVAASGETFRVRKVILATGVKDILPEIKGIQALWGSKAIHCPYCHGWEIRDTPAAFIGNDEAVLHQLSLIYNLNKDLTIFTNGKSSFPADQHEKWSKKGIAVIETPVAAIEDEGEGIRIVLADGSSHYKTATYVRPLRLHFNNELAIQLGCELQEGGAIKVNEFQQTTVAGVLAVGDVAHPMFHQVMAAATGGVTAGAVCNREIAAEDFEK